MEKKPIYYIKLFVFSYLVTLFQTFEKKREQKESDKTRMIIWSRLQLKRMLLIFCRLKT